MTGPPARIYEFGPFRLDPAEHLLVREGQPVTIQPKAFAVLLALVEKSGQLVHKQELLEAAWPRTHVDEASLAVAVSSLRRCLEEDPKEPRYIATVPKQGYRFVHPVKIVESGVSEGRAPLTSLAVLPLVNVRADPEVDYVADGLTESILNRVSQITRLRVIAKNTVARYRDKPIDPIEAGRELNVGAVLTGSAFLHGSHLVVSVELTDVQTGWRLWGARYDRDPSTTLALQDEIAHDIVANMNLTLSREESARLSKQHTTSPD